MPGALRPCRGIPFVDDTTTHFGLLLQFLRVALLLVVVPGRQVIADCNQSRTFIEFDWSVGGEQMPVLAPKDDLKINILLKPRLKRLDIIPCPNSAGRQDLVQPELRSNAVHRWSGPAADLGRKESHSSPYDFRAFQMIKSHDRSPLVWHGI